MNRGKRLVWLTGLMLILVVFIYLLQFLKKKPLEWTPENSLVKKTAPGLGDQHDRQALIRALDLSLQYMNKLDPGRPARLGPDTYSLEQLRLTLIDFKKHLTEKGLTPAFFQYLKENYHFYQTPAPEVIFTGYYEARLRGSLTPSDRYRFPLYRKPDDLVRIDLSKFHFFSKFKGLPTIIKGRVAEGQTVLPYYSRKEIDSWQKISRKNLEILWVDDIIELFFLHIQGSGIVTLDSGESIRVNYAESNGHPYRAIGKFLINRGLLTYEDMSMQSIRHHLETHPKEVETIFNFNPSYVFFRTVEAGPMGSIGVPLTPFRSIAVDQYLFPKGALGFIETEIPDPGDETNLRPQNGVKKWKKYRAFVLNQDSGGAIKGPGRIDLFTGYGELSEWIAGHMKQPGTFYFLIKKKI
jgi:membrane-bound lytic murein transglycosylase A